MAQTVYFHVGLPKTGTTYLQSILWANKGRLEEHGLLIPGGSSRQHMWASGVVRQDQNMVRRGGQALRAWDDLVAESAEWPGRVLISHEFFAGASTEQARAALADLAPADVHLVVTARDTLSMVTSYWQEYVKHGFDLGLDDFPGPVEDDPANEWSWRSVDLRSVLERWGEHVPRDHVHVLVVPGAEAGPEALWQQFAEIVGVDPAGYDTEGARANSSLGLVEAELLRAISRALKGFGSALDRGVWVRGYLANEKLVPRQGERFLPSDVRVAEIRARAESSVRFLLEQGFAVVGDVERLRVPERLEDRRHPAQVTDAELLSTAVETIAELMVDLRTLRRENTQLKRAAAAVPVPQPPPSLASRARGLVSRLRPRGRRREQT